MKLVMLIFNQALEDEVMKIFDKLNIRGFTQINDVYGQGSDKGEPHFGTHIWPDVNTMILTVIPDEKVEDFLSEVKFLNNRFEEEGIHAFTLNV